jgi:hypothetical protein
MLEPGGDVDLAQESTCVHLIADVRAKDFDRYLSAVLAIRGEKDDAHPTAAKLSLDAVPTPDSGAEALGESVGHGGNMRAERRIGLGNVGQWRVALARAGFAEGCEELLVRRLQPVGRGEILPGQQCRSRRAATSLGAVRPQRTSERRALPPRHSEVIPQQGTCGKVRGAP